MTTKLKGAAGGSILLWLTQWPQERRDLTLSALYTIAALTICVTGQVSLKVCISIRWLWKGVHAKIKCSAIKWGKEVAAFSTLKKQQPMYIFRLSFYPSVSVIAECLHWMECMAWGESARHNRLIEGFPRNLETQGKTLPTKANPACGAT